MVYTRTPNPTAEQVGGVVCLRATLDQIGDEPGGNPGCLGDQYHHERQGEHPDQDRPGGCSRARSATRIAASSSAIDGGDYPVRTQAEPGREQQRHDDHHGQRPERGASAARFLFRSARPRPWRSAGVGRFPACVPTSPGPCFQPGDGAGARSPASVSPIRARAASIVAVTSRWLPSAGTLTTSQAPPRLARARRWRGPAADSAAATRRSPARPAVRAR